MNEYILRSRQGREFKQGVDFLAYVRKPGTSLEIVRYRNARMGFQNGLRDPQYDGRCECQFDPGGQSVAEPFT